MAVHATTPVPFAPRTDVRHEAPARKVGPAPSEPLMRSGMEVPRAGPRGATTVSAWCESLLLVERHVPFMRRKVRADERIYLCGDRFDTLYLIHAGLCKIVNLAPDGREQPAGLSFKGDWLGFDGIPTGHHGCSAVALDSGELWSIRYETLLRAGASEPRVMRMVLSAMGTLPADARVADFLLQWAQALAERGLRNDQINVHMTRAEMGNYLGLTLESVSRALSRLARIGVICFNEKGRKDISIPDVSALSAFIQDSADPVRHVFH